MKPIIKLVNPINDVQHVSKVKNKYLFTIIQRGRHPSVNYTRSVFLILFLPHNHLIL